MKYFFIILFSIFAEKSVLANEIEFQKAYTLYTQKSYAPAASILYNLSRAGDSDEIRMKSRLYLGVALYRLNFPQIASFPLVKVVQEGTDEQKKVAMDYMVAIADKLSEDSLLSYTLKRTVPENLSKSATIIYEFRMGESFEAVGNYDEAIKHYEIALAGAKNKQPIRYAMALTYLKMKKTDQAILFFEQIFKVVNKDPMTSVRKMTAIMGLARAYYQAEKWDEAAKVYRQVPKDNSFYRQSLFELSWTLFRSGKLRSALSPIQTLHSPYYQNFYDPESLLLRSTILFYVCKYDEIDKIKKSFEKSYSSAANSIKNFISSKASEQEMYQELYQASVELNRVTKGGSLKSSGKLPFFILRSLIEERDIRLMNEYVERLNVERANLPKTFNTVSLGEPLVRYGQKIIDGRKKFAQNKIGKIGILHLQEKQSEILDTAKQMDLLKYEILGMKKEAIRKKSTDSAEASPNQKFTWNYYVQNGYRYWPFQGEYWRDEIGNYQYVGVNSCE